LMDIILYFPGNKMTTHSHVEPTLQICKTIPLIPVNLMVWYLIKHRDSLILTSILFQFNHSNCVSELSGWHGCFLLKRSQVWIPDGDWPSWLRCQPLPIFTVSAVNWQFQFCSGPPCVKGSDIN
jgi:hypothetical protein